jgi:membrane fusion protein, multidrug efflux system
MFDVLRRLAGGIGEWCGRHLNGRVVLGLVIGVGLVALLVVTLWPSATVRPRPGGGMNEPQPVGVATAAKGDIDVILPALGTVTPLATATVTPQVSGQVMQVAFSEGQMVKKGDLLAIIDPRSYRAALGEAKGQLAKDQATFANAEITLKREKALYAAKAAAKADLDSAEAAFKQAQGTVKSDQASVDSAALKLEFTRVVAPISGRIGLRGVDVGNYVGAGQTTGIAVITQIDPMSVLFTISENSIGDIVVRMNEGAEIAVDAYDHPVVKKLASGRLTAMDSQISTTTGTVRMRAMFDNADGALFPNQFVNVKILVDTRRGQTVIPVTALQLGSQGTYVFVVKSDKTVTMRAVTPGVQDAARVAIVKGLNPGEVVVTDGADRLTDGATVSVPSGQTIAKVEAAESAREIKSVSADRRVLFRKLTPEEREQLHAMSPEVRKAWIEAHRAELMKRKDQPRPPGGGPGGPPGGGPPPP